VSLLQDIGVRQLHIYQDQSSCTQDLVGPCPVYFSIWLIIFL
jgi:hypothetical protein